MGAIAATTRNSDVGISGMRRAQRRAMPTSTRSGPDSERRAHRRVRVDAQALLRDGERVKAERCIDVSLGGVGVAGNLKEGTELEIVIELGPSSVVRTLGQVVRNESGTMVMRFVRLDQRSLTALRDHVAQA